MKLLLDVGNSTTVAAVQSSGEFRNRQEFSTRRLRTEDSLWDDLSHSYDLKSQISELAVVSVVPKITEMILKFRKQGWSGQLNILAPPWKETTIVLKIDRPEEVGADRIAAAEAAYRFYGGGYVVDFGTATTVEVVSSQGEYLGGVIVPGMVPAFDRLINSAAKLSGLSLGIPEEFNCKNSRDAVESGLFYGTAGAVKYLLEKLQKHLGLDEDLPVVGTGGWAGEFERFEGLLSVVDPNLVLKGLDICRFP